MFNLKKFNAYGLEEKKLCDNHEYYCEFCHEFRVSICACFHCGHDVVDDLQ